MLDPQTAAKRIVKQQNKKAAVGQVVRNLALEEIARRRISSSIEKK